jgi:hypothetical protein
MNRFSSGSSFPTELGGVRQGQLPPCPCDTVKRRPFAMRYHLLYSGTHLRCNWRCRPHVIQSRLAADPLTALMGHNIPITHDHIYMLKAHYEPLAESRAVMRCASASRPRARKKIA